MLPELNPDLLSQILAKSAPELTDEDIDHLIAALRAERAAFHAAETANKKKPASAIAKAAGKAAAEGLKFEDLDLGL